VGERVAKLHLPRRAARASSVALGWLLMLAVWFGASRHFDAYVVPSPQSTLEAFTTNLDEMIANTLVTLQEVALGFGIATVAAVLWGAAIVLSPRVRRAAYPLLIAAQTAPKEALAPILVIWFGFSIWGKAVMASLIAFFPILVATVGGLERFDQRLHVLARSMGAGPFRTFFSFRAWNALPSFFASLRLGITLAVVGAVLGEYLGADRGLGYQIVGASRQLDTALLYASLVLLILICWALVALIDLAERLTLRNTRAEIRRAA
jgi:NitT/TauT family transport system permease protein